MNRWTAALSLLLVGWGMIGGMEPARAQFQAGEPLLIPRAEESIELDGRIGEDEWRSAARLPLVKQRSNFGDEPDLRTEILVTYSSDAIYVACRCYDTQPPKTTGFERDGGFGADGLRLILDTFNDEENGLYFAISPTGNRTDATISNDAVSTGGASYRDLSWNTFWEAEVLETDEGWFAEMRIPTSSLRFEETDGRVVMGLTTYRWVVRHNENYVFPAISQEQGGNTHMKPSRAQDVSFPGLKSEPPFRVTPYILGGLGQHTSLNERETAYDRITDVTRDVGLDVKYGLTSNLTLDLTFNTDFAQVEADNQQVNLTRFPLFFPEKRRFFLERASNFAFAFGPSNRLFYSRRIGFHEGHQVRILGGARVVGRRGPWDIGALTLQTARESDLGSRSGTLPSENFSLVRLQRQVLNDYSQVGGIVTGRMSADGAYNVAYGLDGTIRPFGDEYVTAKWAQTFTDRQPERLFSIDPSRVQLLWERRNFRGLSYDLRFDRAGRLYDPGMGFEFRENYFRLGDRIGYGWLPDEPSPINSHQLNLETEAFFRNGDGSLQSLEVGPEWTMLSRSQHGFAAEVLQRVEDLRAPFLLTGDVAILPGRYTFQAGGLGYSMPSAYTFGVDLEVSGGGYYDGRRGTVQLSPEFNPSRYVQVEGVYQLNRVVFPEREEAFTAHVSRLRVRITPNVEHSLLGFVQHNSVGNRLVVNVRYRYNPREGNDLYLVYNEQLHVNRTAGLLTPRLPMSAQRAVLVKYTYTFNL